ncbi:CaiB/BaiF CoA transferase family protein [Trinickia diaoshuihuensis]|uniref:CaiB/BaiF CoA transferase family protein n=1 Tax=Trinickia diaoshuihuensis TaxID=2292265 RepID=UPI000E276B64|nr:CoA transferase [Trinickia diaoshuihuensis]
MTESIRGGARALPLSGIRVLDLSRVLAGPSCAMALADLGAEVIKVEHPRRGDDTRDWGSRIGRTETCYYNSVNRNKRSLTLDLQTEQGAAIARELALKSDIVIENFKLGGTRKFGLDYETLSQLHPSLVYCSISGYGSGSPEGGRPGYDLVIQGESGLMALNGEATQPPLKFGVAVVDLVTGMYAAQAVLAALFDRQRSGRGRHVEMALFDCGVAITSYYGLEALLAGEDPPRYGNAHPSIIPYGVFDAQDGPIVVTVGTNAQFERFCREVIERPDLAEDDRFRTNVSRGQHREALVAQITSELGKRPRALLLERLAAAGIPCGEVMGLHEALTSPRAAAAGLVTEQPHPVAKSEHVFAPPYRLDGERPPVRRAPPVLGEDTEDVLRSVLGLDDEAIDRLKANRIV